VYCSHVRLCARVDDSVQEFGNFQEEDFEGPVQHFDEGKCLDHVANPAFTSSSLSQNMHDALQKWVV
jgi:hypothetical protein